MDRPMHAAGQPARGWRRLWVRGKQGLAGRGAVGGEVCGGRGGYFSLLGRPCFLFLYHSFSFFLKIELGAGRR